MRGYRARQASQKAERRRQQASKHIRFTDTIKEQVEHYLKEDWSPEQISGTLVEQEKIHISHETIYQYVWADNGLAVPCSNIYAGRDEKDINDTANMTSGVKSEIASVSTNGPRSLHKKRVSATGKSIL